MMTKILDIQPCVPYRRAHAMHVAEVASRFEASAVLRDTNATINLKSVIGLLSMAISGKAPVTLSCSGSDEGEAIQAIAQALLAYPDREPE